MPPKPQSATARAAAAGRENRVPVAKSEVVYPNVSVRKRKVEDANQPPEREADPTASHVVDKRVKPASTTSKASSTTGAVLAKDHATVATKAPAKGVSPACQQDVDEKLANMEHQLGDSLADNERLTMDIEMLQAARWEAVKALKARDGDAERALKARDAEAVRALKERDTEVERVRADCTKANETNFRLGDEIAALRAKLRESEALLLRRCTELAEEVIGKKKAITENDRLLSHVAEMETKLEENRSVMEQLRTRGQVQEEARRQMHETIQELKGNIRVFCRVRPAAPAANGTDEATILRTPSGVIDPSHLDVLGPATASSSNNSLHKPQRFKFDRVFPESASQTDVFKEIAQLTQSALDGYKVCILTSP